MLGSIATAFLTPFERLIEACRSSVAADEGPFYPAGPIPLRSDLTRLPGGTTRAKGTILHLVGRVLDPSCRAVSGATVEIWQCDSTGRYDHPRADPGGRDSNFLYFGRVTSGADGSYRFLTIRPPRYSVGGRDRAPHIHVKIKHPARGELVTEIYFEGAEDERIRREDRVFLARGARRGELVAPLVVAAGTSEVPEDADHALLCRCDLSYSA